MKNFKYNRWLIGFIVLGLAAALAVGMQRHSVEKNNTTVELAIDYEGLVELAQIEGLPVDQVLKEAKEAGITSLAVYETTFKKLNESGKVSAIQGSELLKSYHSGMLVDGNWRALVENGMIKGEDVYVTQSDPKTFNEVKIDLLRRLGKDRVIPLTVGGAPVLAVKANYEKFLKWNLGLSTEEMRIVNAAVFYIIARPSNYDDVDAGDVQAVFERMQGFGVSDVIFSGEEILGYPNALEDTAKFLKERDLTLGMIEHPLQLQFYKQEGLMELARGVAYQAARVYSIPKDEQPKMKIAAAVERWVLTDEERNVRINLLRTYEKPEATMSLLETNMTYFAKVKAGLEEKGFTIDKAGTYAPYYPSKILLALMCLGAAAAGVLYLTLVQPFAAKFQYGLLALLAVLLITPIMLGQGATVRSAVALVSANVFPALAVIWQLDCVRARQFDVKTPLAKVVLIGLAALFTTGALSFIGAAYVGAMLGDVEYILEVNIFRGVKLTFVLPIILVTIAFLRRFDLFDGRADYTGSVLAQVKKILNTPIYVKSLVAFGVAALAAFIFIGRSGHTAGVPVPGIELKFRAFLEQALYARPRSKELLIGHPAFMLAVLSLYRKWPSILFYVLVVAATIGQGSLVETFAHLRTPIYMSFMRGLGGLVLGAGIGAVLMVASHYLYRLSSSAGRDTAKHE